MFAESHESSAWNTYSRRSDLYRSPSLPSWTPEEEEVIRPEVHLSRPLAFRGLVITASDWPPDGLLTAARRTEQLCLSVSLRRPSERTLARSWDVIIILAREGESVEVNGLIDLLRRSPNTATTPILLLDGADPKLDYERLDRLGVRRCPLSTPGAIQVAMALHLCWSRPLVERDLALSPAE